MITTTLELERRVQNYWRLHRAWSGQSEEFIPVGASLQSLRLMKKTSSDSPALISMCCKMIEEIEFQLNATDEQLEALP
jgi:hypothetical protein